MKQAQRIFTCFMSITCILLLCWNGSINAQYEKPLHGTELLEGCWVNTDSISGITSGEYWEQHDDRMRGFGFAIKGLDTTVFEYLEIVPALGTIVYLAAPSDENPTAFWATTKHAPHSGGIWVFENKEHDFPSLLSYELVSGELTITVKGSDGKGWQKVYILQKDWQFRPIGWR